MRVLIIVVVVLALAIFLVMPRGEWKPIPYPCFLDGEPRICVNANGMVNYYRDGNLTDSLTAQEAKSRW